MVKTDEQQKILSELEQFTGTTKYYRSGFGSLLLTEGIHYLRERLECYWLVDLVESYQPLLKDKRFQLWSINVAEDSSAVVEMREDTGLEPLVRQELAHTDFMLPQYEWYCVDNVMMLKSEY